MKIIEWSSRRIHRHAASDRQSTRRYKALTPKQRDEGDRVHRHGDARALAPGGDHERDAERHAAKTRPRMRNAAQTRLADGSARVHPPGRADRLRQSTLVHVRARIRATDTRRAGRPRPTRDPLYGLPATVQTTHLIQSKRPAARITRA